MCIRDRGSIISGGYLQAGSTANPPTQGAYLSWNRVGGSGRSTFSNQAGLGQGGFEWVEWNGTGGSAVPVTAMTLDRSGNLAPTGSLVLPTAGGTPSALNYYEEYSYTTTFSGADTTVAFPITLVRIGRTVTMQTQRQVSGTTTTNGGFLSNTVFPARFAPPVITWSGGGNDSAFFQTVIINNGNCVSASAYTTNAGNIKICGNLLGNDFLGGLGYRIGPLWATWIVA